jgi:hypothetical protein
MQIKKDKAIRGLGKIASMTGTARLLQRHPQTTPALGLTSVAEAWERSGSGSGKRERGSAFFKKWSGAKRLRSVFIYIYI